MKKILLTANGLENKNIGKMFLELAGKRPEEIKSLFVPTAANNADAIEVLPKCLHDLLDLSIPSNNIMVYDLHYKMEYEEIRTFDALYFCGGDPYYLLKRINDTNFRETIKKFVDTGGLYVGVSAGSIIAANNLSGNLGYLNCGLDVHGNEGINTGKFDPLKYPEITLPDNRAILIRENTYEVIE